MQVSRLVQDALTSAGGKNLQGKPNYRFAWSGDETLLISNGKTYEQFRIIADDCWLLMKWESGEYYGTPEEWKFHNLEPSGLLTAGPYPYMGRYRLVRKLIKAVVRENVLTYESPEPDLPFVEQVFPMIRDFENLSATQKAQFMVAKDKAKDEALTKAMHDSFQLVKGVATAKQIQAKEEAIERFLKDHVRMKAAFDTMKRSN